MASLPKEYQSGNQILKRCDRQNSVIPRKREADNLKRKLITSTCLLCDRYKAETFLHTISSPTLPRVPLPRCVACSSTFTD